MLNKNESDYQICSSDPREKSSLLRASSPRVCFSEVKLDLPIISTTDYQLASSVKLDIENGRNLISGVVSMAEDGLHALKFRVLIQVYSLLDVSVRLAEM